MKRRNSALLAAMVAVAAGAVGCSDDERREPAAAVVPAAATAPATTNDVDGRVTTTDGEVSLAWGDPGERRESIAIFKRMTKAFRDGRMDVVCRYVSDFALGQFKPGGLPAEAPCPAKLRAFARVVARNGGPPTVRILWVRAYDMVSGVWVENERGRRIRVPLNKFDGDSWKLELGVFPDPEIISARIAR